MSAQLDSMCAMDISGGCESQEIPKAHTKKRAFIPCTKGCRRRRKLLLRCCSSRTIQRCLTSGPFGTGWRLRRTARCLAVSSDRLAMGMQTKCTPAQRPAKYLKRIAALTGAQQVCGDSYGLRGGRRNFLVGYQSVRVIANHGKST